MEKNSEIILYELRLLRDEMKKMNVQVVRLEERMVAREEITTEIDKAKKIAWISLALAVVVGGHSDIIKLISMLF